MKREALTHPKLYHLADLLGCSRVTAIGHLELLFDFVSVQAPEGDIGKWPDGAIAKACDWEGNPAQFVHALVTARFVDEVPRYRLLVHDWPEHAQNWVRARLKNTGRTFCAEKLKRRLKPPLKPPLNSAPPEVEGRLHTIPIQSNPIQTEPDVLSGELAEPTAPPPVLVFPTVGDGPSFWELTEAQVEEWQSLYPGIEVAAECRKALAWVQANPRNRKTHGGMGRFLVGWLNRSQNGARGTGGKTHNGSADPRGNVAAMEQYLKDRSS